MLSTSKSPNQAPLQKAVSLALGRLFSSCLSTFDIEPQCSHCTSLRSHAPTPVRCLWPSTAPRATPSMALPQGGIGRCQAPERSAQDGWPTIAKCRRRSSSLSVVCINDSSENKNGPQRDDRVCLPCKAPHLLDAVWVGSGRDGARETVKHLTNGPEQACRSQGRGSARLERIKSITAR